MVNGQAGKGDKFRPVNREKFSKNYIKIFGAICKNCKGKGCSKCNGLGKIERKNETI